MQAPSQILQGDKSWVIVYGNPVRANALLKEASCCSHDVTCNCNVVLVSTTLGMFRSSIEAFVWAMAATAAIVMFRAMRSASCETMADGDNVAMSSGPGRLHSNRCGLERRKCNSAESHGNVPHTCCRT